MYGFASVVWQWYTHVLVQSISIFICMLMGLVARIDNCMVASSSPVEGSKTLHATYIYHTTS